ncbi:MAG: hypothetical protein VB080_00670 [Propionicimonas sp.]|uniref:hypothetical protein n=1 Tax=Propionicimonas sp. TaxID=1955623 RepID=UPI002B1F276D|nr:hypothetical protein [Propionicimonas sp.]MEA4942927.1 hypothetical protein [Propionicimonas sp.]MEA5117391.1 hypothetical protein [Propionicimonas sp.]
MSNDYPGKYTPPTSPTPQQPSDGGTGQYPTTPSYPQSSPYPQGQQNPQGAQYPQGQQNPQYPQGAQYPQSQQYLQGAQYPPANPYQQPGQYRQQQPQGHQPWGAAPTPYPTTPYSQSSVYAPAPATPRPPMLGIVGLGLVALGLIAGIALSIAMGPTFGSIMTFVPPGASQAEIEQILQTLPEEQLQAIGMAVSGPLTGIVLASLAGTVGWIISIVAAATKRGRGWGIAGIVLGVLAPVVIILAIGFAAAAAIS